MLAQQVESLCIRGGVSSSLCGAAAAIFTSTEFWGITLAAVGAAAAWYGVIRRDRRELAQHEAEERRKNAEYAQTQRERADRMRILSEEHEQRMALGDFERREIYKHKEGDAR